MIEPRLLAAPAGPNLHLHLGHHGPMPLHGPVRPGRTGPLVDAVDAAGLRGRGGGWFPTARKMRAVAAAARSRPPVVVVNAMEGEPLSAKDKYLLDTVPNLVLDGAALAAEAIGANRIILAAPAGTPALRTLAHARRGIDPIEIEVAEGPRRFLAGQETALVNWLNGAAPIPTTTRPFERGVRGRATLVANAETYAHLALIARRGPDWFRAAGTPETPGTTLVSLSTHTSQVLEVPIGTPLADLLPGSGSAVLLGGYGGTWLPYEQALTLRLSPESLRSAGAVQGASIVSMLAPGACGLRRTAAIVRWMADQGAKQCGPCLFGLPAVASDLSALSEGRASKADTTRLRERAELLPTRGACAHPDGVSRLVTSALNVFQAEAARHLTGTCVEAPAYARAG